MANAEISKITLPNGITYDIKDTAARNAAAAGFSLQVVTSLPTASASTMGSIYLVSHSHGTNDVYDEYVTVQNGSAYAWEKIGNTDIDLSGYSTKGHTHSVTSNVSVADHDYTPAGGVSQPTFTGTEGNISVSGTPSGSITISKGTGTANYTPEGTVSKPTFTGTSMTSTGNFTPSGNVTVTAAAPGSGETKNYTPAGTVSKPTFTGTATTSTGKFTPSGSVSTPTITTAVKNTSGAAVTPYSMSSAGSYTASSYTPESYAVSNEVLTITSSSYTKETVTMPSRTELKITATSSQPSFTGTEGNVSVSGTPTGSVSQPTFTGTDTLIKGAFSGTQGAVSVSGTTTGSVSQPTFTGTGAELKGSFSGTAMTSTGKFTPAGTVSKPTFTGTKATIKHSVTNGSVTSGTDS